MFLHRQSLLTFLTSVLSFILAVPALSWELPKYPRLANYYLPLDIEDREIQALAAWDLLVLSKNLDGDPDRRERLQRIKNQNPDNIILLYTSSIGENVTADPPDPLAEACDAYDWWLRDWRGDYLYDPGFPWLMFINMTNTEAASGDHPNGMRANEFLSQLVVMDHLDPHDYWDGVFYDTFSDNLTWIHRDVKDANRNGVPEYDTEEHGGEPKFQTLWSDGMLSLLENTIALEPDAIIVGNGQHRHAVEELNGRMLENFTLSSDKNLHTLAYTYPFLAQGERMPRVSIVEGWMKDQDPTAYQDMRFTLCATLMTDNFYGCDFGSRHHAETLWFDEYSVLPNGIVDAKATRLRNDIDSEQTVIPVGSTARFRPSGLIEIEGEQIHYTSKTGTQLKGCYRGFPRQTKYDLRAPHSAGSVVIQHSRAHTGYLGEPLGLAFDPEHPALKLDFLLEAAGWSPDDMKEEINSRPWQREFENGTVLVNPTEEPALVGNLGIQRCRKIFGVQDPSHNDGGLVQDTLRIDPGDGYILICVTNSYTVPPNPPEDF